MISRFKLISLSLAFAFHAFASDEPARFVSASPDAVEKWCSDLKSEMQRLKWKADPCAVKVDWKVGGTSVEGRPLIYAEFGDEKAANVTLVFTMVHGDEITPVYLGVQLIRWLKEHESELKNSRVVIAPLVNPDGFYRKPKTRMNAHGVDVNRNFATKDWQVGVTKWKKRFRSDPRRFPGSAPRSEPETVFQEEMIRLVRPQKILSVHSPLNHMDYDGPTALTLKRFPREYVHECLRLRNQLRAKSTGYFPGSLGNYAGVEMGIPTITLELPTADANKAEVYWKKFSEGIRSMIQFSMPKVAVIEIPPPSQVSDTR